MKTAHVFLLFLISILFFGCTQQANQDKAQSKTSEISTEKPIGIPAEKTEAPTTQEKDDITKSEIERITAEETKRITDEIIQQEVERLTEGATEQLEECDSTLTKRQFNSNPYYSGPLIDTHLHMPVASSTFSEISEQSGFEDMPHVGEVPTSKIVCLMGKEGVIKAFAFFITPNIGTEQVVNQVKNIEKKYPDKFAIFFMPALPLHSIDVKPSEMDKIVSDNPGLYQGYGELRLDFNLGQNLQPEDKYLLEIYDLSDKHNLIVQMHPAKGQVDAIERLLKKYPKVKFLLHVMPTERNEVVKLMDKYDNIYYSIDAEIHHIYGYQSVQDNSGPTKEEYLTFMRTNFNKLLDEGLDGWKARIESHPDRFTWGTDKWFTWHFDPEVGAVIEEFGRSFIGRLDPVVQEKVAYKNAQKMLEER